MKDKSQEVSKNIYLIGFMGVGKSAIGRRLAHELGARFTDSDQAIEQQAGLTVKQIFEQSGEATFREYERRFVETGHPASGQVIACGGGLAVQPGMLAQLKQRGIVVSLFASEATILKRTRKNKQRPLLNVENPAEKNSCPATGAFAHLYAGECLRRHRWPEHKRRCTAYQASLRGDELVAAIVVCGFAVTAVMSIELM